MLATIGPQSLVVAARCSNTNCVSLLPKHGPSPMHDVARELFPRNGTDGMAGDVKAGMYLTGRPVASGMAPLAADDRSRAC